MTIKICWIKLYYPRILTIKFLPRRAWRTPLFPQFSIPITLHLNTFLWVCFFWRSIFLSLVTKKKKKTNYVSFRLTEPPFHLLQNRVLWFLIFMKYMINKQTRCATAMLYVKPSTKYTKGLHWVEKMHFWNLAVKWTSGNQMTFISS